MVLSRGFLFGFVLPALFLATIYAASMAEVVQYSFRAFVPGQLEPGGFTLDNLARLTEPLYAQVYADSLLIAFWTALLSLLLGYPVAYALVRTPSRVLRSTILIIAIVPLFTGEIVRTYAWLNVLGANGFLNSLLLGLGLIERPLSMMFTTGAVVTGLVHYSMPVMVVILAAAISHIDPAYEKAAASLGAGRLRAFLWVTLPLSLPGIVSGFITIFAWTLSAFATPQLLGGGQVNMIGNLVYQLGLAAFNFPFAAALSLAALVLSICLLLTLRFASRRIDALGLH